MSLVITARNSNPKEKEVALILEGLCKKYKLPLFTTNVIVETGTRPHSHPVLTMNTRTNDQFLVLEVFVHEEMHWFVSQKSEYDDCLAYLKQHYHDNGECNVTGTYPNSFWTHIIVCFNTRKFLSSLLSREDFEYIYNNENRKSYKLTEKLVVDNYEKIEKELADYNMVFNESLIIR